MSLPHVRRGRRILIQQGPVAGPGTNDSAFYRTQNPGNIPGLYMPWNGWEGYQPPSGAHDHFNAISASPNAVAAESLRDAASLARVGQVSYANQWSIDPTYDAARCRWNINDNLSLSSERQLFLQNFTGGRINVGGGETFSLQYELMYGTAWQDISNNTNNFNGIHKTVRCDFTGNTSGDDKRIEMNYQYVGGPPKDYCAQPRWRLYGFGTNGIFHSAVTRDYPFAVEGWDDEGNLTSPPIASWDYQPSPRTALDYTQISAYRAADHLAMAGGDNLKPFLHLPLKWSRITLHWEHIADGELRCSMHMADVDTDPVAVMAQKDTNDGKAGEGINMYLRGNVVYPGIPGTGELPAGDYMHDNSINRVRMEFNSSGAGTCLAVFDLWVRNWVVWRGAKIPLGGRPTN